MPRYIDSHANVRSTTQRRDVCSCDRGGRTSTLQRDVRHVLVVQTSPVAGVIIVALVHRQVLVVAFFNWRPLQHDRPNRRVEELGVRHIGSSNRDAQWSAIRFNNERLLHAAFRAVSGIWANLVPP